MGWKEPCNMNMKCTERGYAGCFCKKDYFLAADSCESQGGRRITDMNGCQLAAERLGIANDHPFSSTLGITTGLVDALGMKAATTWRCGMTHATRRCHALHGGTQDVSARRGQRRRLA